MKCWLRVFLSYVSCRGVSRCLWMRYGWCSARRAPIRCSPMRSRWWRDICRIVWASSCARSAEPSSPRAVVCPPPLKYWGVRRHARNNFPLWVILGVSFRTRWESLVTCLLLKNWGDLSVNACVCERARVRVPKGSWLRWWRQWVGCESPSLPILLLLSDRLWCQIWLVIDSGSCAVVCQQRPRLFFFYPPPSLPAIFGSYQIPWFIQPFLCVKEYLSDYYWQVIHI